jgi:hypothetical protein
LNFEQSAFKKHMQLCKEFNDINAVVSHCMRLFACNVIQPQFYRLELENG